MSLPAVSPPATTEQHRTDRLFSERSRDVIRSSSITVPAACVLSLHLPYLFAYAQALSRPVPEGLLTSRIELRAPGILQNTIAGHLGDLTPVFGGLGPPTPFPPRRPVPYEDGLFRVVFLLREAGSPKAVAVLSAGEGSSRHCPIPSKILPALCPFGGVLPGRPRGRGTFARGRIAQGGTIAIRPRRSWLPRKKNMLAEERPPHFLFPRSSPPPPGEGPGVRVQSTQESGDVSMVSWRSFVVAIRPHRPLSSTPDLQNPSHDLATEQWHIYFRHPRPSSASAPMPLVPQGIEPHLNRARESGMLARITTQMLII